MLIHSQSREPLHGISWTLPLNIRCKKRPEAPDGLITSSGMSECRRHCWRQSCKSSSRCGWSLRARILCLWKSVFTSQVKWLARRTWCATCMCEPSQPGSCSRRAARFGEQTIAFDNPEQASALGRIWGDNTVPWYNLSICKASPSFLGFRLASSLPWGVLPFSPPPIERSSNEAFLDCSSAYLPQGLGSLDLQLPSMKAPPAQLQVLNSSLEVCLMNGEPINWYYMYQLNLSSHLIVPHSGFLLFLMYLNR